jgi:hypothetical protein
MRETQKRLGLDDPQCDPAYAWEAAFDTFNVCTLTLEQCQLLVDNALKAASCLPVKVEQGPSCRYSWCMPVSRRIAMQGPSRKGRGGMNVATVLHEVAHQIAYDAFGDRVQDHGPTWLGIYRKMLIEHGVMTEKEFQLTARKFGLKWRNLTKRR